jgi:outer membrane protein OmpA-like peptidoglycan-associated protein
MSTAQPVLRDSTSYRQGMVLGLTMAETLLLLVFCLLIAAASVFSYKLKQLEEMRSEKQAALDSLREAKASNELIKRMIPGGIITDEWEHLVRDYPNIKKLDEAGVQLKEAAEAADVVRTAIQAKKDGASAQDVTNAMVLGSAIEKEFPGSSKEQIISYIHEGERIQKTEAKTEGKGKHNWPPIITLSEANGHYFDTGSAVLSEDFLKALSGSVIDELLRNIADYPDVNVIEVIGHTDEQPLVHRPSNLDDMLMPVLQGKSGVMQLIPADNAGLGLARAVSVTDVLLKDERLSRLAILPYSGAQLINVNDSLVRTGTGGDVKERRRIEIRLRKSDKVALPIVLQPSPTIKKTRVSAPPAATSGVDKPAPQQRPANTESVDPRSLHPPQPPQPANPLESLFRRMFGN